jgi:hypothetical protein
MDTETRVDELVDRREVMRDQGAPLTIEELCASDPERVPEARRRIKMLEAVTAALDTRVQEPHTAAGDPDRPGARL